MKMSTVPLRLSDNKYILRIIVAFPDHEIWGILCTGDIVNEEANRLSID